MSGYEEATTRPVSMDGSTIYGDYEPVGRGFNKRSSSIFGKLKSALKSPAAEREKAVLAQRPPRRDSDEWSYVTDPEDATKKIKKRKKKMVTYRPLLSTSGVLGLSLQTGI